MLCDLLKCVFYLLLLCGVDIGVENNMVMEFVFLMQQMEWCEGIEDVVVVCNVDVFDVLFVELCDEKCMCVECFGMLFDSGVDQVVVEVVCQLMFIEWVVLEVGVQIECFEI